MPSRSPRSSWPSSMPIPLRLPGSAACPSGSSCRSSISTISAGPAPFSGRSRIAILLLFALERLDLPRRALAVISVFLLRLFLVFLGVGGPGLTISIVKRVIGRLRPWAFDSQGHLAFDPDAWTARGREFPVGSTRPRRLPQPSSLPRCGREREFRSGACRPGCPRAHRARRALHERCHRRRDRRLARRGAGRARFRPAPAHAQNHRRRNHPAHAGSLDAANRRRWPSRSAARSHARARAEAPRTAGSEN